MPAVKILSTYPIKFDEGDTLSLSSGSTCNYGYGPGDQSVGTLAVGSTTTFTRGTWIISQGSTDGFLVDNEPPLLVDSSIVDVKGSYYGAKGDGTTNDTARIVAALTDARTDGGKRTILIPAGTFLVDGAALVAAGSGSLLGTGRGSVLKHSGTGGDMLALYNQQSDMVTIENLLLDCRLQTSGNGITLDNDSGPYTPYGWRDSHHTLRNIIIQSPYADGVKVTAQSRENHVSNVIVRAPQTGHGFEILGTDNYFADCTAATTPDGGFHGFKLAGANNLLEICKAFYCGTQAGNASDGFQISAGRNSLIGCSAQDNGRFGFYFASASQGSTAEGIVADSNGNTGIKLGNATTASNVRIQGQSFTRSGGRYTQAKGFDISDVPSGCEVKGVAWGNTTDVTPTVAANGYGANRVSIMTSAQAVENDPRAVENMTTGEAVLRRKDATAQSTFQTQLLRLTYFTARKTEAINTVRVFTGGTAAGATPTLIRFGIYSVDGSTGDITLINSTANDTTLLAAANGNYAKALSTTFNKVWGTRYAFGALIVTSAAAPTMFAATCASYSAGRAPREFGAVTGQTDLPSSVAAASIADNSSGLQAHLEP